VAFSATSRRGGVEEAPHRGGVEERMGLSTHVVTAMGFQIFILFFFLDHRVTESCTLTQTIHSDGNRKEKHEQ